VVDGAAFLDELYVADELRERGWQVSEEDERTVAQLFCDQLEFANMIVMNKMDLMDEGGRSRLRAILRRFNPDAKLIEATWGQVDPGELLGTGRFELSKAAQHPDWLKEARIGEHTPETVEYGISSITFRSRRPFDAERFKQLTAAMETRAVLVVDPRTDLEEAAAVEPQVPQEEALPDAGHQAALRVVRSKGIVWIAHQRSHWQQGMASLAGRRFTVNFGAPWSAALGNELSATEQQQASELWQEPWGDRRTELVVIGQDMNHADMTAALEACVLTDDEMDTYMETFPPDIALPG
jgi:G3E family GTPase